MWPGFSGWGRLLGEPAAAVVKYDGGRRLGCGGYASRSSRWNARTASLVVG